MDRDDKPRLRWGYNPYTGLRCYIVIEPRVSGFGFMSQIQNRAIRAAYSLANFLNTGPR